ncbi:hypothetical protein BU26DRAFT_106236 [Trematosphaeria pertusa]|uniref:Uncharacterized protein n=1 Tax=Trematosphaeria pertusa TaxID=390896 RepID=A0A6A6HZI3_9PLEO|nr:uncharacterized protein BU26DRAFT_106236 [Trematosphaeria pertusa]KAF2243644.1 hypothetical protein BU26DRAFT_106236 [Trematosphaeria pertusa]
MRLTAVLLGRKPLIHIVMASSVADVLAVTRYNAKQWETFKVTLSYRPSQTYSTLRIDSPM